MSPDAGLAPVAAVVPLFRPDPAVADLVAALLRQVDGRVVAVDDTGDPGDRRDAQEDPGAAARATLLEGLAAAGAVVVRHPRNAGIGEALRTGVATARERWPDTRSVLTVDQDSAIKTKNEFISN